MTRTYHRASKSVTGVAGRGGVRRGVVRRGGARRESAAFTDGSVYCFLRREKQANSVMV